MSFQTGRPVAPPPADDLGGLARLLAWVDHLRSDPNPVWVRELKQSARLTRTPFILMGMTLLMVMIIGTIGGGLSESSSASSIGVYIFHTFFSLAFFVVTLVGPVVAANTLASEREGRTWEALQLTGLPPAVIARGKFMAAYTTMGLYIVTLAPVGAMAFLFGGVTATETVAAFVWLFVLASLSVAFGLTISSKLESMRGAILVTLFVTLMIVPGLYLLGGLAGSSIAHDIWPLVPELHPVWLPGAYVRVPFGWDYVGALIVAPLLLVALPSWFLYEATVANLTSITDDRSTGLRRWFVVASALIVAGLSALVVGVPRDRPAVALVSFCGFFVFLTANVFVFQGEPIGPSRRVKQVWERQRTGALTRALGPGLMSATRTQLLVGLASVATLSAATAVSLIEGKAKLGDALAVGNVVLYGLCFFVFLVGFGAWLRVRTASPAMSRILLVVALFLASVGPWVLAAMAGALTHGRADEALLAAPSPFFAVVAVSSVSKTSPEIAPLLACGFAAAAWALLGLGLLGVASLRCARIIRQHEKDLAESEAFLRAEDEALASGDASAASPAASP